MQLHANLWESRVSLSGPTPAGLGRACHAGCCVLRALGRVLPPPQLGLRHRGVLWARLYCFTVFSSAEEPVLGIYGAVSRAAHLCSHNSCSARLCRATIGWLSPSQMQCHQTRRSAGALLAPLSAPQGFKLEARHPHVPQGSILLPARAGWVLGCPSPALRSLSTPYLI